MIVDAVNGVKGNVEDTEGLLRALEKTKFTALRGPFVLDRFHAPIQNAYILRAEKLGGRWVNRVIDTISNVNQFWTWEPEEYMKLLTFSEMQGKWARVGRCPPRGELGGLWENSC
jgi:branched-chain amino acid transport system substrate-binding protein